ncbi:MAG: 3-deoxy-D-manno-octulosonic acid transferase [Candidatus Syntrophosphaera sp.]|nr:3-deoxy-D-manno-octulosonic acid transferase [Candidatus Syntrophosphaera sp.]
MPLIIFRLFSRILEILIIPLYPLLYLFLGLKQYQAALNYNSTSSEKGILIHAASVGEVNAVKPLLKALQERHPEKKIVVTTTTVSGLAQARNLGVPAHLAVLDLPWLRKKQLQAIDPGLIIIVETEIWPNLLDQARAQGRDVVFVNARMSAHTLRRYLRLKWLWRYLQAPVKAVFTQSEADAERFRQLFSIPVHNAGNLKFAIQLPEYDVYATREKYGYRQQDFLICLGSSRPGEEKLLQSILPALKLGIANLKFIIAIRHPKRAAEVQALFPGHALFSQLPVGAGAEVLLVDTIGHLNEFYAICDIAIVGGSFYDFGGHNPLEPAFYAKPVIMGPHHSSCSASVLNLQSHSAIQISSAEELAKDIVSLYDHPERRASLGRNAKKCVDRNSRSLENHLRGLEPWL